VKAAGSALIDDMQEVSDGEYAENGQEDRSDRDQGHRDPDRPASKRRNARSERRHTSILPDRYFLEDPTVGLFLPRPGQDRFDDVGLGVGVVIHRRPLLSGEFPFRPRVQSAVRVVGTQPISKGEMPIDLR
jgi:hypothetical protein